MRLVLAVALVLPMTGAEVERAMTLARGRDAERQQFHRRYVIDRPGPDVTQFEIITEFRRLVIIGEEHVQRGDWMFTRGTRAAQEAIAPTRGQITLRAQIRFNPLNTFVQSPPYTLAVGGRDGTQFEAIQTQLMPQYSVPFKTREGQERSSLIGATIEADVSASRIGQSVRTIGVMLDGKDVDRAAVDFSRLD